MGEISAVDAEGKLQGVGSAQPTDAVAIVAMIDPRNRNKEKVAGMEAPSRGERVNIRVRSPMCINAIICFPKNILKSDDNRRMKTIRVNN